MRSLSFGLGLFALSLTAACGSSSSTTGSATLEGTLSGKAVPLQSAAFFGATATQGSTTASSMLILMGSSSDLCGAITSSGTSTDPNKTVPNEQGLAVSLVNFGGPLSTQTYPLTASGGSATGVVGVAEYYASDAAGKATVQIAATSGSITLTSVGFASGTTASGTYDLTFGADHVTGSFNAPWCPALIAKVSASGH